MLTVVGVALLLYYLFKQKPKWFTAFYQSGNEATPTSADDYADVGGSTFTPTGSDGTGDLIPDPNSDQGSDGGGVMESFVKDESVYGYYDPAYQRRKDKLALGGRQDDFTENAGSRPSVMPVRGSSRTIAPVSVLR